MTLADTSVWVNFFRGTTTGNIGWVDVQLLASALVTGCPLWTFDRSLAAVAEDIDQGTAP